METPPGLRERKKVRTHRTISETAIALFVERGYDQVSVAEIAAAAEVSKRTLFAYFSTKDDLILHRFADHEDEAARVVRHRSEGQAPLDVLHRHLRSALTRRDPISGLCDDPNVVAYYRLVVETPALTAALTRYLGRSEDALMAALREATPLEVPRTEQTARLAACQIVAVLRVLAHENQVHISAGQTADARAADAVAEANHAFDLLRGGLEPYRN
ncbi:MAG: TetR family transcriptional regulator [Pseudonocardiales bacterium]|nr:TetR family transcriptional regulator [Pseudonocardiales bacterium]